MNGLNSIFKTGKPISSKLCVVVNTCYLFVPIVLNGSMLIITCVLLPARYFSRLHGMYSEIFLTLLTPKLTGSYKEDKHHVLH